MKAKINWKEVETEYVAGDMSYADIAKKYNCAKSRVSKVGNERDWVKKRNTYRTNVAQNSLSNARVMAVKNNTLKLENLSMAADKMIDFLNEIMDKPEQFYLQILRTADGAEEIEDTKKADTRAVRDVVNSMSAMTDTIKKLEEALTAGDDSKNDVTVEMKGDIEKWAQ